MDTYRGVIDFYLNEKDLHLELWTLRSMETLSKSISQLYQRLLLRLKGGRNF